MGKALQGGECIALSGELGAGKTVFVRGMAVGLGIPPDLVTSPSFALIQEYQGRLRLVHADFYRLESVQEIHRLGWHEYYEAPSTITVIEWADRLGTDLPSDCLCLRFEVVSPRIRVARLAARGVQSRALMARLSHDVLDH